MLPTLGEKNNSISIDWFTGIDFVKINDDETAKKYGIIHPPALIYFRKRTPMVYDGILIYLLIVKEYFFYVAFVSR